MDDEAELYLSRCLKNWAASQRAPLDGKERLLLAAALPPQAQQSWAERCLAEIKNRYARSEDLFVYPRPEPIRCVSLMLSSVWIFNFSTNYRLAH